MKSEKEIAEMKAKLKEWVKELVKDDADKFDLEAEADGSLSLSENKREIKEKLLKLGLCKDEKALASYQRAQELKLIYEKNLEAKAAVDAYNDSLKALPRDQRLDVYYANLVRAVQKLKAGYSNALYVKGAGGVGKTWTVKNVLLAEPRVPFVEIRGDCTAAYLYRLAYENNTKILYFNDCNKLLKNNDSLNMLKAMTELDGDRKIMKYSYSKQQDDLPHEFIFKGRVIFDYNYVEPTVRVDFDALISRGDYTEINLSPADMRQIMRLIAKDETQQEVTEWVISNYAFTGKNPLNLRTQAKAFLTYQYAVANKLDWKSEVEAELNANMSKVRGVLYTLIGKECVRVSELIKLLLMSGEVNNVKTAYNRVNEWLLIEELHKWSSEERNFYIGINSPETAVKEVEQLATNIIRN
jgi:hypothetical protein